MLVNEFFKLSAGHIAFVGQIEPNLDRFIRASKADLYIGGQKVKAINILVKIDFPEETKKKERD